MARKKKVATRSDVHASLRDVTSPSGDASSSPVADIPEGSSAVAPSQTVDALLPVTTRDPQHFPDGSVTTSVARGREHNFTNR